MPAGRCIGQERCNGDKLFFSGSSSSGAAKIASCPIDPPGRALRCASRQIALVLHVVVVDIGNKNLPFRSPTSSDRQPCAPSGEGSCCRPLFSPRCSESNRISRDLCREGVGSRSFGDFQCL